MKYKYAIGAATGIAANSIIQKSTQNFWLKEGEKAAQKRNQAYNAARGSGASEDQAFKAAEKANPLWKKLGSNRINGIATMLIGATVSRFDKKIGYGILGAGAAKAVFASKYTDLVDYTKKLV